MPALGHSTTNIFMMLFYCMFFTFSLNAYLTPEEEVKAIYNFAVPLDIKNNLDLFFSDTAVRSLFVDRSRSQILPRCGVRRLGSKERLDWYLHQRQNSEDWTNRYDALFTELCNRYCIESLANPFMNTFILSCNTLWPGYLLKISRKEWLNILEQGKCELIQYKNISRVFYNEKLNEFAIKYNAQYLHVLKKYLYHIPTKPTKISDRNYIVVVEKFENLPSIEENKAAFYSMVDEKNLTIKPEFLPLVKEIVQAIIYVGLYDFALHNIFLVKHNESFKVVIVDTERHGYFDSDANFFHKSQQEVNNSGRAGILSFIQYALGIKPPQAYKLREYLLELAFPRKSIPKKATHPEKGIRKNVKNLSNLGSSKNL